MNRWKISRHEFEPHFRQAATHQYKPQILSVVQDLLRRLVVTPDDFSKHIHLYVSHTSSSLDSDCPCESFTVIGLTGVG